MAWIITKDHLNDEVVEVLGPSIITDKEIEILKKGKGKSFRLYDDDHTLYYSGKLIGEDEFEPLDDYGTPNAGCTTIEVFENGKWEQV